MTRRVYQNLTTVTTASMLKSCPVGVAVVRDRGIHPDQPSVGLGKRVLLGINLLFHVDAPQDLDRCGP